MSLRFFVANTAADLKKCFPVMKELRPHLNFEEYLDTYEHARKMDEYQIVGFEENGNVIALMGCRIVYDYVRGRHLYIDDLVSTEKSRSQGVGAKLLKHAEVIAKEKNCKVLRLCTGIENTRGMNFYEKNGWTQRAYAYTKKLEA